MTTYDKNEWVFRWNTRTFQQLCIFLCAYLVKRKPERIWYETLVFLIKCTHLDALPVQIAYVWCVYINTSKCCIYTCVRLMCSMLKIIQVERLYVVLRLMHSVRLIHFCDVRIQRMIWNTRSRRYFLYFRVCEM